MTEPIQPQQRFTAARPCPICGGHAELPQHQGVRCYGFVSTDGLYAHCTREEVAGCLDQTAESQTYAHRLDGDCRCGNQHRYSDAFLPLLYRREKETNDLAGIAGIPPGDTPRDTGASARKTAYDYRDANGQLVATHIRLDLPDGTKRFAWKDASGATGLGGKALDALPLYRLPELMQPSATDGRAGLHPVYFTEGEKACEALVSLGVAATCLGGGAMQRRFGTAFAPLKGRTVITLADNDPRGRTYMGYVTPALVVAGATPIPLELPDLPERGDAWDWVAAGGDAAGLARLTEAALAAAAAASTAHPSFAIIPVGDLLAEEDREPPWLVDGLLPAGGSSLLVAKAKTGKSTLIRQLLASVVLGGEFLGRRVERRRALYFAIEEKRGRLRDQLRALGFDDDPLYLVLGKLDHRGPPMYEQLAAGITETGAGLVVIDPLFKFVRIKDGNDYAEVSRILEPLTDVARQSGAHLCIVHHANKGSGGLDASLGSSALNAAVDTILLLVRDGQRRTVQAIQRYGEDLDEVVLAMDDAGRITITETVAEARESEHEARVWAVVQGGAFTESQIVSAVGGDRVAVRFALRQLVSEGFIERRGTGKRGDPYEYAARTEEQ